MRIVFMGTPAFAADILDEVASHHDVVCVYTQPDKVRGRGKVPVASEVKQAANRLGIPVRCPNTLKDLNEISYLIDLEPEVICVAAYGMILPKEVLDIPPMGCLNVHASLLPKWRGAAPIERAILSGDEYAGVCIMRMEEGLDTGDWCVCRKIPIEGLSAPRLSKELASLGASALLAALEQCESGRMTWTSQDDSLATYANKIEKRELWLDPEGAAKEEFRKVLASGESHPSKADIAGKVCTLVDCEPLSVDDLNDFVGAEDIFAGRILTIGKRLILCLNDGAIEITSLKPDGKRLMNAKAFLAGAHLTGDSRWSKAR